MKFSSASSPNFVSKVATIKPKVFFILWIKYPKFVWISYKALLWYSKPYGSKLNYTESNHMEIIYFKFQFKRLLKDSN